ncbi:MAG: hypothetical protein R2784_10290 [Saprospiraceae bacterium]
MGNQIPIRYPGTLEVRRHEKLHFIKIAGWSFRLPSPKDDIDGSEVGNVYWNLGDLPRIAIYCEKDVLATIQLLLKFMYMPTP